MTRDEIEIVKKIFDDLAELLTEIRSDARQKREENNELEHSLHFYTGKIVACGEIVGKLAELKKKYKVEDYLMFQIIDKENNHLPVKSRFLSASQAYKWAKKNLPIDSFSEWGKYKCGDRYYIKMY